jgi:ubiquinone/menaquinone biosynthesis C-methylase UbiE
MHERIYKPPIQRIELGNLPEKGIIIDVGGGGDGLVSRIAGARVCAVDINIDKIREARIYEQHANWLNCDGQSLCFVDDVFDTATLWFSLGYLRTWDMKQQVLHEINRVLKADGELLIWACRIDCEEVGALFRVDLTFPDRSVSRFGFGVAGQQNQTISTVSQILDMSGFDINRAREIGPFFYIHCKKHER